MNSRLYRVIFNKHLGRLVVVSEKTVAQSKAGNQGGSDSQTTLADSQTANRLIGYCYSKWLSLTVAVLISLGTAQVAHAEIQTRIIADTNAAKNEQATVLTTASGMTQVNIQTPSTGGVSKNSYSQFDVGRDGIILNNSRKNTQTQTAGWIEGNPWLATGEAKVILNQVNSSNPSQLAGYTEIAGGRAELVIANPAGITCLGCGFINASRATLTTGKPQVTDGKLTSFDVDSGKIRIDGKGMDSSTSNYTQLISQATELNAKVYAKNLDIITGTNQVNYDSNPSNTQVVHKQTTATTNTPTGVALDVSNLGGMYAGKIRLIGTDKGMGVTNAGDISATSLSLDSQGNLTNSGYLGAKEAVNINTHNNSVTNSGTIASSQQGIKLGSSSLTNSGLITAREQGLITNSNISNTGTISAGQVSLTSDTLNNQGRIEQTGSGKLAITTDSLTNQHQAVIGQALYADQPAATTPSLANAPSTAATGSQSQVTNTSTPATDTTAPILPAVTADGHIRAKHIDNQGSNAIITANGGMYIATQTLTNTDKSSIAVNGLQAATSVDNTNSRMQLDNLSWQLASFSNNQGQLVSKNSINLTSQAAINNQSGVLATLGDVSIHSDGSLNNAQGLIQGKRTTILATSLDNTKGSIDAKGNLTLNSQGDLINNQGAIQAQADATINASNVTNDAGLITAKGALTSHSQSITNSGQIYGGTSSTLTSGALNNSGMIASGGANIINASGLSNTDTGVLAAGLNADGSLSTNKADLTVTNTGALTSHGTHIATGSASLTGNSSDLSGSTTQAGTINLTSDGDLSTKDAKLTATDTLSLSAKETLNNQQGQLAANTLNLTANRLDNQAGSITQAGNQDLTLAMQGGINNQNGVIDTNSNNLTIATAKLTNQAGSIQHAGSGKLDLTAGSMNNSQQGQVLSLGEQIWHVAGDINNENGAVQGNRIDINANNLRNQGGVVAAISQTPTADSRIQLTGTLNNKGGKIANTASGLNLNASSVNNTAGQVVSSGQQTWQLAGDLTNQGKLTNDAGVIQAKQANIQAGQLQNHTLGDKGGLILTSQGDLNLTGNLDSQGDQSVIQAAGNLTANAGSITHANGAMLSANKALTLKADSLSNDKSFVVANEAVAINAGSNTNSGTITSVNDGISLTGSSLTNTDEGNIQATKAITITQGSVSNQGKISTIDNLTINSTERLNNQNGVLAGSDVNLTAQSLNNQSGLISQSATDGTLNISTQGLLDNQNTKTTDATKPTGILANGSAAIDAGDVTNQAGRINANALTINSTGSSINNNQGEIAANQGLTLIASNAAITNQVGQILANTTVINTTSLDNSNQGLLLANQDLSVNAGTVDNSDSKQNPNAQLSQGIVAGRNATLTTNVLTNSNGQVVAADAVNLNISQKLINDGGRIESNTVKVTGNASVDNSAGLINGYEQVDLNGKNLANAGGQLRAPTLNVAITNSYTHGATDKLEADTLNFTTQGNFSNRANLATAKRLAVSAQNIDNQKDANLISGDVTELNAIQDITNRGLINGYKTYLTADSMVNNFSHGRIYGDYVAIKANTLNNTPEGNGTPAPVIAARTQLDIGIKNLNNNPNPDRANKFNADFNGQAQLLSNG